jgi:hypothetical protein
VRRVSITAVVVLAGRPGQLNRSIAAVDLPLFGESRQPSDKQTWLKRHLRIDTLQDVYSRVSLTLLSRLFTPPT